jgi:hypothetical protein
MLQTNRELHTRAQIVLTLDGLVISPIAAIVASNPEDLKTLLGNFRLTTWILLLITGVALLVSIVSAALCLMATHRKTRKVTDRSSVHEADDMWFFGDVARVDRERFLRSAKVADEYWEARARLVQAWIIAPIVRSRANWLNSAYGFAALAFSSLTLTIGDLVLGLG